MAEHEKPLRLFTIDLDRLDTEIRWVDGEILRKLKIAFGYEVNRRWMRQIGPARLREMADKMEKDAKRD